MNRKIYYAKSIQSNGVHRTVKEHLQAVAELAAKFGEEFGQKEQAETTGLFHDFGKYGDLFQEVLEGTFQHADHALPGGAVLYSSAVKCRVYRYIMEAINGHHDGLLEYDQLKNYVEESWKNEEPVIGISGKTSTLSGKNQYQKAMKLFMLDFPTVKIKLFTDFLPSDAGNIERMLYTRMLFSCLVDADYNVSASDTNENYLTESDAGELDAELLLKKLTEYQEMIRKESREEQKAKVEVNQIRDQVFEQCGKMGEEREGLFTLTAPTGTGKTLALLHFALRHCAKWKKKRIIIVLPFLTLTEQNAKTYRAICPELLEDHSQIDLNDSEREYASRWSAPVIVTTSVRFFETLFAHKPGDCRKLHNIANSVVVFDEAQSLPAELTTATLFAVNEICKHYRCTMVFSTATQPDFSALSKLKSIWKPREILPDHKALYEKLKRTQVEWRIEKATPFGQIAEEMLEQKSVCVIVNLRKHARKVYELLKDRLSEKEDEVFLITTDLCTAHRRHIVKQINERLKNNLPCRVVATQCIEAGVDFDFEVMYRSLGPLDAIVQAAGRCNRNGKNLDGGHVIVFIPDEEDLLYPGNWYQNAAVVVKTLCGRHPIDIHNPEHIAEYYQLLFNNCKDKEKLRRAIDNYSFADVDREYTLIENKGVQLIVPYFKERELYYSICDEVRQSGLTPGMLKKAAPITITVPFGKQQEKLREYAEQIPYWNVRKHCKENRTESHTYILFPQNEKYYDEKMGLKLPENIQSDLFW